MEMFTYFHGMSLKKNSCGCMIFLLPIDKQKNLCRFSRGFYLFIYMYIIYIYIYIALYRVFGIIYSRSLPMFIEIYCVGDNRTVYTSTSPLISEQLGIENVCETLLCWFIVMLWILVCNNMYQYERHFGSCYRYSCFRLCNYLPKLAVGVARTS